MRGHLARKLGSPIHGVFSVVSSVRRISPTGVDRDGAVLDQVREALRVRHRSRRTEEAYVHWIRDLNLFHGKRHPRDLSSNDLAAYFNHLVSERAVSASTRTQALSAVVFLYKRVLGQPFERLEALVRPRRDRHVPTVLTPEEVARLLHELRGPAHLVASLLYGAGLRLLECCTLRVKDIDLERREVTVRCAKGRKDRRTMVPVLLIPSLRQQLAEARSVYERDLERGVRVAVPHALTDKYPRAESDWRWRWVFPATRTYTTADPVLHYRHHLHETVIQRAVAEAVRRAQFSRRASCHTLRHSFATHCSSAATTSERSRSYSATTQIYTHVLNRGPAAVLSPLDALAPPGISRTR
jgi:integron integrase